MTRRTAWGICALVVSAIALLGGTTLPATTATLPDRLSDATYWRLSVALSEGDGFFHAENLVSNEHTFQYVIPALVDQVRPGGVYLGVAPDQNFTYIVATRPAMAFILDIRRNNLLLHLLYKALFELSPDRAEFLSRLFARPRPRGLTADASVFDLFQAYAEVPPSEALYRRTVLQVVDQLTKRHGFPLQPDDLERLDAIAFAFFWDGPRIHYSRGTGLAWSPPGAHFPTFEELLMQADGHGIPHSYLASEENFRFLKQFEEQNLLVPVVGDFAGPKALRGIGQYVRDHGGVVSAFYVSNVEQYLYQEGVFPDFARNVATLPVDRSSTFIRSVWTRFGYQGRLLGPDRRATALYPIRDFVRDFEEGELPSYYDLNRRSR